MGNNGVNGYDSAEPNALIQLIAYFTRRSVENFTDLARSASPLMHPRRIEPIRLEQLAVRPIRSLYVHTDL